MILGIYKYRKMIKLKKKLSINKKNIFQKFKLQLIKLEKNFIKFLFQIN